jgi:hypothetical protein
MANASGATAPDYDRRAGARLWRCLAEGDAPLALIRRRPALPVVDYCEEGITALFVEALESLLEHPEEDRPRQ